MDSKRHLAMVRVDLLTASHTGAGLRVLALFGGVVKYGAERGALEALSALRDEGATVLLMVSDAPWAEDIRRNLYDQGFELSLCPYLVLPRPDYSIDPWCRYPWIILRASLALLVAKRRFRATHILVGNQLYVLNFLPGLLLSRTPLIYRAGDKPIVHNALWRAIWRFIVWRSGRFVANSHFVAQRLKASGVPSTQIDLIYNRPRMPHRTLDPRGLEAFQSTFIVAFAGQINAAKGVHVLVDAFRRVASDFPAARLWIAGRISDWAGDAWARNLRDDVLSDDLLASRAQFFGFVEDVPSMLAQADLAVVPTLTEEPLGGVVLEAKGAGTACVVFPSGGLPELIEHGVDGHVCESSTVEALEIALRYYLIDPLRAARHGRAAAASLGSFGGDSFAQRWVSVCRPSLGGGGADERSN
ncbi:MAG: glycosyltransferase family 4 protein [Caulobacter sp.]|nr:glycosyltransferase family 4 protein [Caulobacter sp.]